MKLKKSILFAFLHLIFTINSEESTSTSDLINTDIETESEISSAEVEVEDTKVIEAESFHFDMGSNDDDEDQTDDTKDQTNEDKIDGTKEITLLDLFGERTKDVVTEHMIPDTNKECKWNWKQFRCEPLCNCTLLYKLGDYHLGRSCRLKQTLELSFENIDECEEWVESNSVGARAVRFVSNKLDKFDVSKVQNKIKVIWNTGTTMVRQKACAFVEDKEIEFMYDFCEIENVI